MAYVEYTKFQMFFGLVHGNLDKLRQIDLSEVIPYERNKRPKQSMLPI